MTKASGASSLATRLGPLELAHPLINASGTFDLFETEACFSGGDPLAWAGLSGYPPVAAYVPKTVTLEPRRGNEPPRILETAAGMLNSIGLPNMGLDAFVADELPRLRALPCPVIVNVGGFAPDEYVVAAGRLCEALDGCGAGEREAAHLGPSHPWTTRVGLELNVSCPNVHSGCMSIGTDADETRALVTGVRAVWPGLLVVKLTPNVTDIVPIARAAVEAGADALSLVNTFKGLAVDRISLRPYLGGITGGLSGPAIKPLALRFVFEVGAAVDVPLIGMGGVETVQDVLDFLACGATAVAVGAAGFRDPLLPARLAEGLRVALERRGVSLADVVGIAHR
ncbi:MAG: beta/alpha barrel domain-containing protein [Thermoleophilia bacterium]